MRLIHNINKWSFIVTLVLYISVIGGMLAQLPLGVIQIILAIAISLKWRELNSNKQRLMIIYWSCVLVFGLLCGLLYMLSQDGIYIPNNDAVIITLFFVFPMIIAAYFVYVTYENSKNDGIMTENIEHINENS